MRVVIWVGVVALLAAVVPWVYGVWQERSAAEHEAEVWAADHAELVAMLDRLELPEAYRPIDCPTESGVGTDGRCWRTDLAPSQAAPDLVSAFDQVGLTGATTSCMPDDKRGIADLMCSVSAPFGHGRQQAILATRDIALAADAFTFTGTTTLTLPVPPP